MSALLAFVPAVVIGCLCVLIAWPGPYRRDLGLKLSLSLALGPGIVSCLYFAWCLILRPRSRAYFLAEWILLAALAFLAWRLHRYKAAQTPLSLPVSTPSKLARWLFAVLLGALLLAGINFSLQSLMQPHGIQDAWNIWNMRARFMFRGGPAWTDIFSPNLYWLNHADYPFLVTAGVARAWSLAGREITLVPIVQAVLYAVALIGMVFFGVSFKRGMAQAAFPAIILAGSPIFVILAGWQIADVPLAFFLTASSFFLILLYDFPQQPGLGFLFGLCLGLAAWSKNEGIPWAIVCLAAYVVQIARRKPFSALPKPMLPVLAGLALPLADLLYLKLVLAPASDLFTGQPASSFLSLLLDPNRYLLILQYGLSALAGVSPIGLAVLPTIPFLCLLLLIFSPHRKGKPAPLSFRYPAAALFLQGVGYFVIYLITPHDLVWHLRTAIDRLIFHLTSPLLLLVFLTIRSQFEQKED